MTTRLSAEERRDAVIVAATVEFAKGGLAGTSTEAIAKRAGVSQPYLFQLFGTKRDLFVAVVRACFERVSRRFTDAAQAARTAQPDLSTDALLEQMGHAYIEMLLSDRTQLRLQLHAYAACWDPEVRAVVRQEYARLWQLVAHLASTDPQALVVYFGQGMLFNVIASIDDARTMEEFKDFISRGFVAMA